MSATTSFLNSELPPLLFGSPPFSPRSPSYAQTPMSPPPLPTEEHEDVDMNTSITLPAQNHDRQAAVVIEAGEGDGVEEPRVRLDNSRDGDETAVGSVSNQVEIMDTTPDGSPAPVPVEDEQSQAHSRTQLDIPQTIVESLLPLTAPGDSPSWGNLPNPSESVFVANEAAAPDQSPSTTTPPQPSMEDLESNIMSSGAALADSHHSDSDVSSASSQDDHILEWHEIPEHDNQPDEHELAQIEAMEEISALDDDHWQRKAFTKLMEPEYEPGETGVIRWELDRVRGTKDNPVKDVVFESPKITIGGHEFVIKFFPYGNDSTNLLSVYLQCESVVATKSKTQAAEKKAYKTEKKEQIETSMSDEKLSKDSIVPDMQSTPVQLLSSKGVPKRKSVAAQFALLVHNPAEPRVHFGSALKHRFCPGEPDFGFKHHYGNLANLATRQHLQREPLYRNDKLAFTAHIRLVEDSTGCLYEHSTGKNPWNNLTMTGMRGISSTRFGLFGGNIVSTMSILLVLKPFRDFLYSIQMSVGENQARKRPKPLLEALQKTLYLFRAAIETIEDDLVSMRYILRALDWYGLGRDTYKQDVVELWEDLRTIIEYELGDSLSRQRFTEIFGAERNQFGGAPSYRIPVIGRKSIQDALDRSSDVTKTDQSMPEVLTIELARWVFNESSRKWQKRSDKVKLNEVVVVQGQTYHLFGFVVQSESTQTGRYYSVIAPQGAKRRWYKFSDSREDNKVQQLTRRAALQAHEGSEKSRNNELAPVAYLVTYIREDVAKHSLSEDIAESDWRVPQNYIEDLKRDHASISGRGFDVDMDAVVEDNEKAEGKLVEYTVTDSKAFVVGNEERPGIIDFFNAKWINTNEYSQELKLDWNLTGVQVREKIASMLPEVKDPRQLKLWLVSSNLPSGRLWRPQLIDDTEPSSVNLDYGSNDDCTLREMSESSPERRLWMHIVDFDRLPPLPPPEPVPEATTSSSNDGDDDMPMGGVDAPPRLEPPSAPPPLNLFLSGNDTEMGGLASIPGPPPISISQAEHGNASNLPPTRSVIGPNDVYFFLKLYKHNTLMPIGDYFVNPNTKIQDVVRELRNIDKTKKIAIYVETSNDSARKISGRFTSFRDEKIKNGSVLIYTEIPSDEEQEQFISKGIYSSPRAWLIAHSTLFRYPKLVDGKAKLNYFAGEFYEGSIKYRVPHGHGKKIDLNNDTYVGDFRFGERHGMGTMVFANGDTYEGQWAHDLQEGPGIAIEAETGNKYVGEFKEGKQHGEGITYWIKATSSAHNCKVCWEKDADCVLCFCGHVVCCMQCAGELKSCPLCTADVKHVVKLFYAS